MAYGYLLAPSFQFVNINGRPIANGHIEVFLTNTDTKYITKCDFNGTDNPFKIPLNSKGMAVVIASGDYAYDVFCYDRFGSLFWSGSNIRIEGATGVVIDGANLPLRIVGGKIDNNGKELTCTGENAWAEGAETTASGANAHAEGGRTTASGEHSHSEGFSTTASSGYSHAEGAGTKASNTASHAEGQDTTASGQASHAEGRGSVASGDYSHASGRGTRATGEGSHAVGKFNDDGEALFVVGNGTASNIRKDVFKVDRNEDTWVMIGGVLTKVTNVSGSGDQFVLVRSNMTTDFTNAEYQDCVDAVTNEKAVCVQFTITGSIVQAQLTAITGGNTLEFELQADNYHYTWSVAATPSSHVISASLYALAKTEDVEHLIATEWNDSDVPTYGYGTLVFRNGILWSCNTANPSATFVPSEWDATDVAEELKKLQADRWFALTPTTSQSEDFRINSSGSVEIAAGYRINRYYVAGLGGKTIRISADYNSVFSTTASASQKITTGLPSGEYIVPANANFLIVSHTTNGYFEVDVIDYVIPPLYSANKTRIAPYDQSAGYKINSSGSVVSDPEWTLIRFHTDTLLNNNIEIDTEGYSVFSTSPSVGDRVTLALEAGDYVVPSNGTYLIISVKTNTPYNVYLVTDDTTAGKYGTYGLQMRWSENTTYRLRGSIGKSFAINNSTGVVTSDFDTCYPWCDMRICNIENPSGLRTITYKGETGFSYNKDTYVEIPKFYFKRVFDPNTEYEYWYISSKGGDGFELEPLFRNDDGTEAPVRYIARYNLGVGGDISRTGIAAYTNVSKSDLKSYCEANNVKLMNIFAYQALVHLFVVESGTKDSQSIFSGVSFFRYFTETTDQAMVNASATTNTIQIPTTDARNTYFGVGDRVAIFPSSSTDFSSAIIRKLTSVSYSGSVATLTFDGAAISLTQGVSRIYGINQLNGNTDSITANSGRTTNGDQHTRSFSYRGIENLWGNLGELVDGVEYDYDNRRFKIGNKYVCFETPINRTYIEVPSIQRWIKYFGVDPSYPTITLPSAPLTESVATSYTDEWSTFGNESGVSDVSYGCAWDHQNANGVMCFRNVRDSGNILYTGRAML